MDPFVLTGALRGVQEQPTGQGVFTLRSTCAKTNRRRPGANKQTNK